MEQDLSSLPLCFFFVLHQCLLILCLGEICQFWSALLEVQSVFSGIILKYEVTSSICDQRAINSKITGRLVFSDIIWHHDGTTCAGCKQYDLESCSVDMGIWPAQFEPSLGIQQSTKHSHAHVHTCVHMHASKSSSFHHVKITCVYYCPSSAKIPSCRQRSKRCAVPQD